MKTLKLEDFKANTKEWFLEQLGNMSASQALQTISDLYDELHKPKYPTTYEECCKVLGIQGDWHLTFKLNNYASCDLYVNKEFEYVCKLEAFRKLPICRNSYWKIAGEQMGLGKPWKPDWDNDDTLKYCIIIERGIISKQNFRTMQAAFAFPTEEIRDAFYENFKDLINKTKELL